MPRVLLTGFGPFGSHEINPTESIVNTFPSILPIKNPFGPGSCEVSIEKRGKRENTTLPVNLTQKIKCRKRL